MISLDQIRIASPCHVGWDNMKGDDRVRFCEECHRNVYNISALTTRQAEKLIEQTKGRICVSIYRRLDGTILTADCPVGVRLARRVLARSLFAVATVCGLMITILTFVGCRSRTAVQSSKVDQLKELAGKIEKPPCDPCDPGTRSDGGLIP